MNNERHYDENFRNVQKRKALQHTRVFALVASPTVSADDIDRKARTLWIEAHAVDPMSGRVGRGEYLYSNSRLGAMNRQQGFGTLQSSKLEISDQRGKNLSVLVKGLSWKTQSIRPTAISSAKGTTCSYQTKELALYLQRAVLVWLQPLRLEEVSKSWC